MHCWVRCANYYMSNLNGTNRVFNAFILLSMLLPPFRAARFFAFLALLTAAFARAPSATLCLVVFVVVLGTRYTFALLHKDRPAGRANDDLAALPAIFLSGLLQLRAEILCLFFSLRASGVGFHLALCLANPGFVRGAGRHVCGLDTTASAHRLVTFTYPALFLLGCPTAPTASARTCYTVSSPPLLSRVLPAFMTTASVSLPTLVPAPTGRPTSTAAGSVFPPARIVL